MDTAVTDLNASSVAIPLLVRFSAKSEASLLPQTLLPSFCSEPEAGRSLLLIALCGSVIDRSRKEGWADVARMGRLEEWAGGWEVAAELFEPSTLLFEL